MPVTCKRTGKGTAIAYQPMECVSNVATYNAGAAATEWIDAGCLFGAQPPTRQYDTVTGELCLNDSGEPVTDLGDLQADSPTFTIPFCTDDTDYQAIEDWCDGQECMLFRYTYPAGDTHHFFGYFQAVVPDEIERTTFMRTAITILRTSSVYRAAASVPAVGAMDCASCREA